MAQEIKVTGQEKWRESDLWVIVFRIDNIIKRMKLATGIEKLGIINEYREKCKQYENISGQKDIWNLNYTGNE